LISVEFAPINHNDLLLIKGTFHWTPSLPYFVGNEGVGRVLALGPEVSTVKVGDRVLLPIYSGTSRERVLVSAEGLFALPREADVQQLAMLWINPTAAGLLLSEYVDLKPGDWVIQNASNSGVGRAVIAFAKARGLRLINLVRRQDAVAERIGKQGWGHVGLSTGRRRDPAQVRMRRHHHSPLRLRPDPAARAFVPNWGR
jgi:NADPH:quinone reductase-like Zn-dependent oxidoreductase